MKKQKKISERKMGMTKRLPQQPKKINSGSATLTEHHKNVLYVVPTVRNS